LPEKLALLDLTARTSALYGHPGSPVSVNRNRVAHRTFGQTLPFRPALTDQAGFTLN
jgi:hypothetical protein